MKGKSQVVVAVTAAAFRLADEQQRHIVAHEKDLVEGMSDVTRIIGNPRVAWQWLVQPKPSIGGTPLARLRLAHEIASQ